MQNKITTPAKLLNEKGELNIKGYANSLILDYDRNDIKASSFRIKEWDYYLIYDKEYAIALTIDDNSYMGLISASIIDYTKPKDITQSKMTIYPNGSTNLPNSSKIGDTIYKDNYLHFQFLNDGKTRKIKVHYSQFYDKKDLDVDLELTDEPDDSMVIATPFKEDPLAFYYNQKIIGMKVKGYFKHGDLEHTFKEGLGILDWGRGVWTYDNTWNWSAACGYVNGEVFGFNLGYGFGDTSNATENMLFYKGKAHKLKNVYFVIPKDNKGNDNFMETWSFISDDGRFEMYFEPIINRKAYTTAIILSSDQNQVFGKFTGYAILDDGTKIEVNNFIGFAEKVRNKW